MRYKVELAEFHTVIVEACSKKEAEEKVAVMDDEEILKQSVENTGMEIWGVSEVTAMLMDKAQRVGRIQNGLRIKDDCFAYDKDKRECTALNSLYCLMEECSFYKPKGCDKDE